MDWREFVPGLDDVPTAPMMLEAGFPSRLIYADAADVRGTRDWTSALAWWDDLEANLRVPRGLAMWESGGVCAATCLTLLAKRFMCWPGLPVPRGTRIGNVGYTEARALFDSDKTEATLRFGVLVVGGVGVVEYGLDRSIEAMCAAAQMRKREGVLTLWHLEPAGTARAHDVCMRVLAFLGSGCVVAGTEPPRGA